MSLKHRALMSKLCLIVLGFIAILLACAPRDNPFDPNSPYAFPRISGIVMDIWERNGVPMARVEIDGRIATLTDENGRFELTVDAGDHLVVVSKDGYMPDSARVTLDFGEDTTLQFRIDAFPQLDSASIAVDHIVSNLTGESYILKARCRITDPDGIYEIDSVFFQVPDTIFVMEYETDSWYFLRLDSEMLPSGSAHSLVGQPLFFEAVDVHGGRNSFGPFYITRIIEDFPSGIYPIGGTSVDSTPTLIWHSFNSGYPITYELELYSAPVGQPPALVLDVHSLVDTTFTIAEPLDEGYYYWVVFAVDGFQNSSRSVEYLFQVVR